MNVNALARWYRWIEYAAFGRALERARFAYLNRLAPAQHVLILGEGDGRTLERLLRIAPDTCFDVIEASSAMIALARRRTGSPGRVRFFCQSALDAWPEQRYDGVVTNFFLDCFSEADAREVVRRVAGVLLPNGVWLISEFALPPKGWRRWHASVWIWTMYRFFRVTTGLRAQSLPPIERLLTDAGMLRAETQQRYAGLLVADVWKKSI